MLYALLLLERLPLSPDAGFLGPRSRKSVLHIWLLISYSGLTGLPKTRSSVLVGAKVHVLSTWLRSRRTIWL